jgi:predicted kinase
LRQRAAAGTDASEAGVDVLRYQTEKAEALTSDELLSAVTVDTETEVDIDAIANAIRQLATTA